MAPELSTEDFPAYFEALWGYRPFEWQTELVSAIEEKRSWPSRIDLPTGTGKTSVLDIATFLLALDGGREVTDRWMPRRVALVVDRRVIVDQADERASHIARSLDRADDGPLRAVAQGLRALAASEVGEGSASLSHTVLRGGIVRDESWAQRPDVPAILSSTIDQVGSRILFRGYGISRGMRPVHGGLLGNDTLFLLDEVHLARPFAESLRALDALERRAGSVEAPRRWTVVDLSATPTGQTRPGEWTFPTAPLNPANDDVLRKRLTASKPAELLEVKVPKDAARATTTLARKCAEAAAEQVQRGARTVAVIVNRVNTAREVARAASELVEAEMLLLTGRMRSLDRQAILHQYQGRLMDRGQRSSDGAPLLVVATQSIEAGADFDFDAIVTECAGLDALRQRFGRVDRRGELSAQGRPFTSTIVIRSTDVAESDDDPVYGPALASTWSWLTSLDHVDFGIHTIAGLLPADLTDYVRPPDVGPHLLPSHLDRWAQTSQLASRTEPDVAPWLHGVGESDESADVTVIWRADVDESLLAADLGADLMVQLLDRIAACPPVNGEGLAISLNSFRRWARTEPLDAETLDVLRGAREMPEPAGRVTWRRVVRVGADEPSIVEASQVRPGDTIVVPTSRGGLFLHNWDPTASEHVLDLGTEATRLVRNRAVVRLHPAIIEGLATVDGAGHAALAPDPNDLEVVDGNDRQETLQDFLASLRGAVDDHSVIADTLDHLLEHPDRMEVRAFADALADDTIHRSYVVWSRERLPASPRTRAAADEVHVNIDEDGRDGPSFTGTSHAPLDRHLVGVGAIAASFATALGLPSSLAGDLRLAGALHDAGKADPRFQRWLRGDEPGMSDRAELLAKSTVLNADRRVRRRNRGQSGYPEGARHEMLSLAMSQSVDLVGAGASDPDLVLHLVSSHHGHGRYRFTPVEDPNPLRVSLTTSVGHVFGATDHMLDRLDQGVPDRYWRLTLRYGWYLLAWLESILRLADHTRSRLEQTGAHNAFDQAIAMSEVSP